MLLSKAEHTQHWQLSPVHCLSVRGLFVLMCMPIIIWMRSALRQFTV
jgi:hypothetical protein